MKEDTKTLIQLRGINPFLFWCMPIIYSIILICIVFGDVMRIFIIITMLLIFYCSYDISTFKVKIREEDQDNG